MSFNLNQVNVAGRLTRDPETRQVGESSVTGFGLATNETWRDRNGEKQERTTFVDVEAWGKTGELVAQYLSKGSGAMVVGKLQLDQWSDRDGKKQSKLKVVAVSVQFTDPPSGDRNQGQGQRERDAGPNPSHQTGGHDDQAPF